MLSTFHSVHWLEVRINFEQGFDCICMKQRKVANLICEEGHQVRAEFRHVFCLFSWKLKRWLFVRILCPPLWTEPRIFSQSLCHANLVKVCSQRLILAVGSALMVKFDFFDQTLVQVGQSKTSVSCIFSFHWLDCPRHTQHKLKAHDCTLIPLQFNVRVAKLLVREHLHDSVFVRVWA